MYELNSLAHRYYLEDLERAARHDIAMQRYSERNGSLVSLIRDLVRTLGGAFSPFGHRDSAS